MEMVEKLADSELNEAVARKLGASTTLPDAVLADGTVSCHWLPYATSISAAWQIVEFMKDEYFSVSKCLEQFEGHRWQAQVGSLSLITAKTVGYADTAPRAICEAFLKLP